MRACACAALHAAKPVHLLQGEAEVRPRCAGAQAVAPRAPCAGR